MARVGDLTESMIGSDPTVVLGTHGAETNGFVKFLVQIILPRYGSALPPADFDQFMRGGRALIEMMRIIGEHTSGVVPPHEIQTFVEATCAHLTSLEALGIPRKPKHHMMMERTAHLLAHGAPHLSAHAVT